MRRGRRQRHWRVMEKSFNDNERRFDVVIITCFAANEPRAEYVQDFFRSKGKTTKIISTNFIHRGKYYRTDVPEGYALIKTKPYKKNLSVARLYSHYQFSKKAFELARTYSPYLIYVLVPANSLAESAWRMKEETGCKLVIDLVDLWPESLPCGSIKDKWPFTLWRSIRDKNIPHADLLITECELYQKKLELNRLGIPVHVAYWPQEDYGDSPIMVPDSDPLRFLYLGSINNIIDIDAILRLLVHTKKCQNVELQVVGDGEKREQFLAHLDESGIPYQFHGYVYEHEKLREIAAQCHWGINMMKPSVQIGLTMKAVSYFELGLPVVNNIKGDTWDFVAQRCAGINVENVDTDLATCLSGQNSNCMRVNARKLFEECFSRNAFERQLEKAVCSIWRDL